jgi:hypothetical protein
MFHVFSLTEYVTLASTRPGNPFEDSDSSRRLKVMESCEKAVTFQKR